jgi:hypothetical protein
MTARLALRPTTVLAALLFAFATMFALSLSAPALADDGGDVEQVDDDAADDGEGFEDDGFADDGADDGAEDGAADEFGDEGGDDGAVDDGTAEDDAQVDAPVGGAEAGFGGGAGDGDTLLWGIFAASMVVIATVTGAAYYRKAHATG